jgi:hypothetical protein
MLTRRKTPILTEVQRDPEMGHGELRLAIAVSRAIEGEQTRSSVRLESSQCCFAPPYAMSESLRLSSASSFCGGTGS